MIYEEEKMEEWRKKKSVWEGRKWKKIINEGEEKGRDREMYSRHSQHNGIFR